MIQYAGQDICKKFWEFSKTDKELLAKRLAIELPALRGKVNASQEEIASAVGISRQTFFAFTFSRCCEYLRSPAMIDLVVSFAVLIARFIVLFSTSSCMNHHLPKAVERPLSCGITTIIMQMSI